jgi:hypothetical protein
MSKHVHRAVLEHLGEPFSSFCARRTEVDFDYPGIKFGIENNIEPVNLVAVIFLLLRLLN